MRDIQRLERMALDAIEQLPDPTLTEIVDYIGQRRRLWIWTYAGILVAVLRLEGKKRIEVRRSFDEGGGSRWRYYVLPAHANDDAFCRTCTEPRRLAPGARARGRE